jgi:HD superfamily phosphohydrolase
MELATRIFDSVMRQDKLDSTPVSIEAPVGDKRRYWRRVLRMAALCHDIGHLPFSHAAEKQLLPQGWDHEDLTVALIRSEEMETLWQSLDVPLRSADIVKVAVGPKKADTELNEWETIFSEIIVGDVFGADRMDYLLRDSLHSGVAYGRFDHHRLVDTLRILPQASGGSQEPVLGVEDGGLHSAEALLLARYFMYTQVYFHPVRRIYDFHLQEFLQAWKGLGGLPTDPEEHLLLTDHEVYAAMLDAARTPGAIGHAPARRIVERDHFREIYRRNPRDTKRHPDAARLLAKAVIEQFGEEEVHHDTFRGTGGAMDFPVLMPDGRVESSIGHSDVLRTLPVMAVDTIYVATPARREANEWLKENRERIFTTGTDGGRADGEI